MEIVLSNSWRAVVICSLSTQKHGEQRQIEELLFASYPVIHEGYQLSLRLGEVFRHCTSKEQAFKKLAL